MTAVQQFTMYQNKHNWIVRTATMAFGPGTNGLWSLEGSFEKSRVGSGLAFVHSKMSLLAHRSVLATFEPTQLVTSRLDANYRFVLSLLIISFDHEFFFHWGNMDFLRASLDVTILAYAVLTK